MAKTFAPRTQKKDRTILPVTTHLTKDLFKFNDDRLMKGAQLLEVNLKKIVVKSQVRTKFDDESLRDLAENIKSNGLIQPLVVHREGEHFVLLCGERRYRAMNLIGQEKAPCYVLEGKSADELMAIQFSENSSREELHYIDKANGIMNYHLATGHSERKIQDDLGISKSEVHRGIILGRLPHEIKNAAKVYNIEKYVLLEYASWQAPQSVLDELKKLLINGTIVKRSQFQKFKSAHKSLLPSGRSSSSSRKALDESFFPLN
jgi:ParB family chromosome partitioning protein